MGKDSKSVTTMVRIEPMVAPQMPANSGSLESPWVNRRVLKRLSTLPDSSNFASQANCLSLIRRSLCGVSRGTWPLITMSTSSEATSQTETVRPIRPGSSRTMRARSNAAPWLTSR